MVYAQAYCLFKQGYRFYFNKEEIGDITESNEQFQLNTAEEELLITYFEQIPISEAITLLTATQILEHICERTHVNHFSSTGAVIRLGRALRRFGFERRKSTGIYLWAVREKFVLPPLP